MSMRELRATLEADRLANAGYPKSRFVLTQFRWAQYARRGRGPLWRVVFVVVAAGYRLSCEWILGIELPTSTPVGPGVRLRHGVGLVVNPHAVIGRGVMLRQNVTIGNRRSDVDCPVIGEDVEIGAGAMLLGAITIGDRARIGAGAIVLTDVPADGTARSPAATVTAARDSTSTSPHGEEVLA